VRATQALPGLEAFPQGMVFLKTFNPKYILLECDGLISLFPSSDAFTRREAAAENKYVKEKEIEK
jgi:hypothetical protein